MNKLTNQSNSTQDTEDVVGPTLVQWLRDKAKRTEDIGDATDFVHAADEIQSLSDRIDVLGGLQRRIITQYRNDLSGAHAEICKLQKLDPATHSWPDWTPQANTLRWFDELERAALHQEGIAPK